MVTDEFSDWMQDIEEAIEALHPDCRMDGSGRCRSVDARGGRAVPRVVGRRHDCIASHSSESAIRRF
jgi:hypothetical protein